jgi:hypothetical protein
VAFGGVIWESKARNLFYRGTLFLGDMYTKKTCIVVADILGQDILYSCGLSCIEFFDVVAYPGPRCWYSITITSSQSCFRNKSTGPLFVHHRYTVAFRIESPIPIYASTTHSSNVLHVIIHLMLLNGLGGLRAGVSWVVLELVGYSNSVSMQSDREEDIAGRQNGG